MSVHGDTMKLPDLERRRRAIALTRKRFAGKPHRFGVNDCVKVGAAHIRNMGHRKSLGLAKAGGYKNAVAAKAALRRAGFECVADALIAAGFAEIAPAAALPGDLLIADGSHGLDAVGIVIAHDTLLGFQEEDMAAGMQVLRFDPVTQSRAFRL